MNSISSNHTTIIEITRCSFFVFIMFLPLAVSGRVIHQSLGQRQGMTTEQRDKQFDKVGGVPQRNDANKKHNKGHAGKSKEKSKEKDKDRSSERHKHQKDNKTKTRGSKERKRDNKGHHHHKDKHSKERSHTKGKKDDDSKKGGSKYKEPAQEGERDERDEKRNRNKKGKGESEQKHKKRKGSLERSETVAVKPEEEAKPEDTEENRLPAEETLTKDKDTGTAENTLDEGENKETNKKTPKKKHEKYDRRAEKDWKENEKEKQEHLEHFKVLADQRDHENRMQNVTQVPLLIEPTTNTSSGSGSDVAAASVQKEKVAVKSKGNVEVDNVPVDKQFALTVFLCCAMMILLAKILNQLI